MRYFIFLSLLLCLVTNSIAQDFSIRADTAYEHKQYKEAIKLYKKQANFDNQEKKPHAAIQGLCNYNIGKCYYALQNTDSSIYFYKQALPFYRSLNDWSNVGNLHTNITLAHASARLTNLKWSKPIIYEEDVKEVYFKITKVDYFSIDSIRIEINAGSYDGVITGLEAKCLGALKKSKPTDRTGWLLANAKIMSVTENKTILAAKLYDTQDTMRYVYVDDIASIYCKFNRSKTASLLQDLSTLHICMFDNYMMQMYEWRDFLTDNDSLYENDILEKMRYDVKEIYEMVKDDKDYDTMYCSEGLFKSIKMTEALNNSSVMDIRAFLQFVRTYPGKYAGMRFKLSETYATWIINNCPSSAKAMVDYYLHQPNRSLKIDYLKNYAIEIHQSNYFDDWKNEVLKDIKQNNLTATIAKLEMLKDASYLLKNDNYRSWYYYCNAKYYQKLKDTSTANSNFRKALTYFTSTSLTEGIYLCNEALNQKNQNKIDIVLQNGHSGFFSLNFSPDGKYFVTGSTDNSIKLWDARLGKEILTVAAHDQDVTSVAFSYDGRYIISTSHDQTVKLWDADNLKLLNTFNTGISNTRVILSKNAETFLVSGKDSVIQQWSITENKMIKQFSEHRKRVYDICRGINENEFYSCGADSLIYKWDIKTNETIHWYKDNDRVTGIQTSPDGHWMSATLANGKLRVWDLNINKAPYLIDNLKSYTNSDSTGSFYLCQPAFSADSRYLIYGAPNYRIKILELATGKIIIYGTQHYLDLLEIIMSDDGTYFATVARDFSINIFDFKNYVFNVNYTMASFRIKGHSESGSLEFDNESSLIIYGGALRKYNLTSGKSETIFEYLSTNIGSRTIFDAYKKNMVFVNYYGTEVIRCNIETKALDTLFNSTVKIKEIDYNFITGVLFVYDIDDNLHQVVQGSKKKSIHAALPDSAFRGMMYNSKWSRIFIAGYNFITVYDTSLHLITKLENFTDTNAYIFPSISGNYLFRSGEKSFIDIIDARDYHITQSLKTDSLGKIESFALRMSPNDSILLVGRYDGEVQLWDWRLNKLLKKFKKHEIAILSLAISSDGNYFATSSLDDKINLYHLKQTESLCTLYSMSNRGILTITDSNYYIAPRSCYDGFVFRLNKQIYTPEQFDLFYHRPDKVVQKIGAADEGLVEAYYAAYIKRVKRSGLDLTNVSLNLQLPLLEIVNKENLPITTSQNSIRIKVKATDLQYNINAIRLWVNNIPIYGALGLPVKSSVELEKDIDIVLQNGRNTIKIAAVNEKGTESLKEYYEVVNNFYDSTVLPKVHLVVISVSKYRDKSYNLKFAAKDGRDLIAHFKMKFPALIVDSFIDGNAVKEKIMLIKNKLLKTNVNDRVIIFVSGHGLLDDQLNFYFATHDVDFKHPETRGLSYEQINELLDGIPARQKLLLMDACHSGEIDKDATPTTQLKTNDSTTKVKQEYVKRGSVLLDESKVGLQNSFELMQDLFSDLSNGNGAVVISAASGTGYALESATWNNGVFTYSILNGLKNNLADLDKNGTIRVSELSQYINQEVQLLTHGNQKPNSRAENLEYDWGLW